MNKIVKDKVNKILVLTIIVIAFFISLVIMLKYKTEGETKMPFIISELMCVSSADATSKETNEQNNKWNLDINQYNDVYISLKKNEKYSKNAFIKSITIKNLRVNNPNIGTVEVYMPNTDEKKLFSYDENLKVNDSVTFKGGAVTDFKNLTVSNQGGNIVFRIVNRKVSEYVSNNDDEIAYDGSLLQKTNVSVADIKFTITFDIIIETENTKYKGTKTLTLPCENVDTEGVAKTIDYECKDIIFKREK